MQKLVILSGVTRHFPAHGFCAPGHGGKNLSASWISNSPIPDGARNQSQKRFHRFEMPPSSSRHRRAFFAPQVAEWKDRGTMPPHSDHRDKTENVWGRAGGI